MDTQQREDPKVRNIRQQLAEIKAEKLGLLADLKEHAKHSYLNYFKPHDVQQAFFDAMMDPKKKVIGFQGGNRAGKTTSLIAGGLALTLGRFPWSGKELRYNPPIRLRLVGEDQSHHLKEILVPKIKSMINPSWIECTRKNNQGVEAYWYFKNGSTWELMSYEQNTDIFEGWDGHVVLFDEPPPRDKYVALKRGLVDHDGLMLMTFTPLKEPWIYDELVTNPDPAIAFFNADIRDNPHLNESAIAEFERSLSPEEKEARIKGGWLFLQGLVYKDFDKNVHVVKPFVVPNDYSVYVAIDTHPRTEQALMFVAVDEKNRCFVIHDVFQFGTPEEVGDWIVDFHKHVHEIDMAIIEPASKGDENRGDSTFDIIDKKLGDSGIILETGSRDLAGGILKVKDALRSRNGQPSLFVFEDCERTIYEFTRYVWDEWRMQGKDPKQKPKDKDDHMMENLRRLIQHPVEYRPRSVLQSYVQMANEGHRASDPVAGY